MCVNLGAHQHITDITDMIFMLFKKVPSFFICYYAIMLSLHGQRNADFDQKKKKKII